MSSDDTMTMINRILAEVAEVTENETTNLNLTETDQMGGKEVTRVKVRWTPVHPLSLHLSTWWKESSCSAQDVLVSSLTLSLLSSSSDRDHTGLFTGNTFQILYTCNALFCTITDYSSCLLLLTLSTWSPPFSPSPSPPLAPHSLTPHTSTLCHTLFLLLRYFKVPSSS